MKTAYTILIIFWVLAIGVLVIAIIKSMNGKSKKDEKIKASKNTIETFNKLYKLFITVPFISKEIASVKKRLYDNFLYEDAILKYKAALYYLLSWIVGIFLFLFVCVIYRDNMTQIIIMSVFCYYLKNIFLDTLVGDDTKLLSGLVEYTEDLIPDYQLKQDVNEAVEDAKIESSNQLIVKHIENMATAIDDEAILEEYINNCPNEYLRLLVLNCYMTREYGDTPLKEGESAFVENLKYTNKLINIELAKRYKLKYWLRGASLVCILPLLSFLPYGMWVDNYLPILNNFYKTSWGFILKIGITLTLIGFFFILRKYTNIEASIKKERNFYWEERLLKIPPIKKFIKFITPKQHTAGFYRMRSLINKSQVNTKIEWVQIQKIVIFLITIIFYISMIFVIHSINRQTVLADTVASLGITNGAQVDVNNVANDYISAIGITELNSMSYSDISQNLNSTESYIYDKPTIANVLKNVIKKSNSINNEYVKWYEILICIALAFGTSKFPILYLKMKIGTNNFNMYSEVMLFESIILILMNYDNTTTESILEYMSKFAHIFKKHLDQTVYNLQEGTKQALNDIITDKTDQYEDTKEEIDDSKLQNISTEHLESTVEEEVLYSLIDKVDFKPFKNLIKNLMKSEDIPVKEAFSTLSSYRNEYAKEREEGNNKVIAKRINIGNYLSIAAISIVIVFYIAIPFATVSTSQLTSIQEQVPLQ